MSSQSQDESASLSTHISDESLFEHASRLKDKVVLITGAANGIGKETALKCAEYGAKVVIGDLDVSSADKVVQEIEANGGQASTVKCDVTVWKDVVGLYNFAMDKYGNVDVVVPNAGVNEIDNTKLQFDENNQPKQPSYKTLNINITGVMNTVYLAQHYLLKNHVPGSLKAVVLIGSMASWQGIPLAPQYSASKHAVLGLMRSLHPIYAQNGIRIGIIHPFFADTAIVPPVVRLFLAGVPLTPVPRIAGAIIYSATNPDLETSGNVFLLPDNGPVFMLAKEEFKLGVYKLLDARANALFRTAGGIVYAGQILKTYLSVLGKPLLIVAVAVLLAYRMFK